MQQQHQRAAEASQYPGTEICETYVKTFSQGYENTGRMHKAYVMEINKNDTLQRYPLHSLIIHSPIPAYLLPTSFAVKKKKEEKAGE